VILNGKQKAAMLLMSLDAGSATELLKGVQPEVVEELALELAKLDESGLCNNKEKTKVAQEFCNSLIKSPGQGLNIGRFLNEILVNILGEDKAASVLGRRYPEAGDGLTGSLDSDAPFYVRIR